MCHNRVSGEGNTKTGDGKMTLVETIKATAGRTGQTKRFISDVYADLMEDGLVTDSLAEFKRFLGWAAGKRLLDLSRCDLPEAFDPETVKMSTTIFAEGCERQYVRA
jgi:hypothetical protein